MSEITLIEWIGFAFTTFGIWMLYRAGMMWWNCISAEVDAAQWGTTCALLMGIFGTLLMVVGELVDLPLRINR